MLAKVVKKYANWLHNGTQKETKPSKNETRKRSWEKMPILECPCCDFGALAAAGAPFTPSRRVAKYLENYLKNGGEIEENCVLGATSKAVPYCKGILCETL